MAINWRALAPHRPLSADEAELYASRPGSSPSAEALRWLNAGDDRPIALFGPTGSGKSTELAVIARGLREHGDPLVVHVQLDRELIIRRETGAREIAEAIAGRCVTVADEAALPLSNALRNLVRVLAFPADHPLFGTSVTAAMGPRGFDLLRMTCSELRSKSPSAHPTLLIDGLEKLGVGLQREVVGELLSLRDSVRVVVVVSVDVATGPDAHMLVHEYRLLFVGPVVVDHEIDEELFGPGHEFLEELARRRLGLEGVSLDPAPFSAAAHYSGGVPRVFLQLLQDAATRAAMRGEPMPKASDMKDAARDLGNQISRLLREGDMDALQSAEGSEGKEIEIERRLRLLAHGILLEYETNRGRRVLASPLVRMPATRRAA